LTWFAFWVFIGVSIFSIDPIFTGIVACYLICLYISIIIILLRRNKKAKSHSEGKMTDNAT
jgi:hypothetical protein